MTWGDRWVRAVGGGRRGPGDDPLRSAPSVLISGALSLTGADHTYNISL